MNLKKKKYTAIFSWKSRNKWIIDYPLELNKVHKQRYVTKQKCLYFLKKIYQKEDILQGDNFIDVPIKHFTLDEMLEFKKEDEMTLNGQNPDQYSKKQPKEVAPVQKTPPTHNPKPLSEKATTPPRTPPKSIAKPATKPTNTPKPTTPDEDSFFSL